MAVPILVQRSWPVSIDTVPWLFMWMLAALLQAAVEVRRRLRLRAETDADSGLPNRSMLEQSLATEVAQRPIVVVAAIEQFEVIRDSIGLAATSDLLRAAGADVSAQLQRPVY